MSAADHIEKARIFVTLAVERLTYAAIEVRDEDVADVRLRIAQLANQGLELELLQASVLQPNAELIEMLGVGPGEAS